VLLVDINPFSAGQGYLVITILSVLLIVPIGLGALTVALFLIMRGRRGQPQLGVGGLFLAMVILMVLAVYLPSALSAAGFFVPQPHDLLGSMIVCAAVGTLIWMLSVWRRWKEAQLPLAITFLLLAGLLIVAGGYALLQLNATLGSLSTVLLAALFLLPTLWSSVIAPTLRARTPKLWSYVISDPNEQDTIHENPLLPHEGRVWLKTGYTLVGNALLLYLGTLRDPITRAVPPPFLQSDLTASSGLLLLGPALVVMGFILGMRQHVPHLAPAAKHARRISPMAMQVGIVGSGTLVTVLVTTFMLITTLPRLIQTSENRQYTAAIPGPDCDPGGATWSVTPGEPISTTCLQSSLQVMIKAQNGGTIEFTPPSGVFTQNYRVSVQVEFDSLSNGCIVIVTHALAASGYQNQFCTSRSWTMRRVGKSTTLLAFGQVAAARQYTIEATTDGPDQRLMINGVEVGNVSDTAFSTTAFISLGTQNLGDTVGAVVFSNFVFTPLPALPPTSPQTTYRVSAPGVACDKGEAQWALMTPQKVKSSVVCQSNGTLFQLPGGTLSWEAFTPPSGLFPHNYQVSVQANLGSLPKGCVAIEERVSGENYYQLGFYDYILCTGGSWRIIAEDGNTTFPLASGKVTPAAVNTLEASAQGPHLRFTINGVEVGSASDSKFTSTTFIRLSFVNNSNDAGAVFFSNFIFTPLS